LLLSSNLPHVRDAKKAIFLLLLKSKVQLAFFRFVLDYMEQHDHFDQR
jgi:hypothetical protein